MPYSRHTCPSLKLRVLCHYPCCQLQWDCSEATATLQGPQVSGRGQATFWSTAGMNGLAASRASCHKLYQYAAPTDGSPLEKPPAAARVALTPAFCSPRAHWHESGHRICTRGKITFKNTHAPFGTLLRLSNSKRAALGAQPGSLQWSYLW